MALSDAVRHAPPPGPPCRLLAFDTATERTSLAVVTPEAMWTLDLEGGPKASATLIGAAMALLDEAGSPLEALDAIAYGCGPGAFTGLRTTCAVAQGLAWGADKPVLPVDSLLLVAESVRATVEDRGQHTVWVAQDARMDEIYAAAYRWQGDRRGRWQVSVPPALYTVDALNARWAASAAMRDLRRPGDRSPPDHCPIAVVGSALSVMGDRLQTGIAPRLDAAAGIGRARALGQLAVCGWDDGGLLDASYAMPLYLRDKVALTTAEREAARSAP